MIDIKKKFTDECKSLAEKLLNEYGEFYPFALGVISEQGTLVDIETEVTDDMPNVIDEIAALEHTFIELDNEYNFVAVCICVNVTVVDNVSGIKSDALEIRADFFFDKCVCIYVPYQLSEGRVSFGKDYEELGKFMFFNSIKEEKFMLNKEVYTLKSIFSDNRPILYVIHDSDDRWQFLSGHDASIDDLTMVPLGTILEHDSSIAEILRMKKGSDAHKNEEGFWVINNDFSY